MLVRLRQMPAGIRVFLVFAASILIGIGLSLRYVIDEAVSAPVSLPGVVVMALLAYTIFTTTLVLQRKAAARGLALALSSITVPTIALLLLGGQPIGALVLAALAVMLFAGLLQADVRDYLNEP
ncbi:MAG: hypothetical protein AABZ33_11805 [Chloroflexota bacterium]